MRETGRQVADHVQIRWLDRIISGPARPDKLVDAAKAAILGPFTGQCEMNTNVSQAAGRVGEEGAGSGLMSAELDRVAMRGFAIE